MQCMAWMACVKIERETDGSVKVFWRLLGADRPNADVTVATCSSVIVNEEFLAIGAVFPETHILFLLWLAFARSRRSHSLIVHICSIQHRQQSYIKLFACFRSLLSNEITSSILYH